MNKVLTLPPPATGLRRRLPRHAMASLAAGARQLTRQWLNRSVNDWDLFHQATGGDPRAAEDLVRRLTPAALAIARQMLGRSEDAEDVVQESFLRLWSAQAEDNRGAQLSTYFHTIVLNRCRSLLVRQRELSTDPELLADLQDQQQAMQDGASAPAPLDTSALRDLLQRLPARQRMALALWAYADADAEAIGRALHIDANAAHQLLFRARRQLRALWQEQAP